MELAERLGISFKRLSGWEPTTYYVYDASGRLVESRPEVEWDDAEVGWMLALERYRRENLCPLCGLPKDVCQAPYGTYTYSVENPTRCNVKTAIRSAQASRKDKHSDALIFQPLVRPWGATE